MKSFYYSTLALCICCYSAFANINPEKLNSNCEPQIATLDLGGGAVISANSLYAVAGFSDVDNVARFSYFPESDVLAYDATTAVSTGFNTNYGLDYNPANGLIYYFANNGGNRNMYSLDVATGTTALIATVTSSTGANNANAMAFDSDGTLYVTFGTGELNSVDLVTGVGTALGTLPAGGGAGITYDFDNDRLIYTTGTGPIDVYEIDKNTGVSNLLFQFAGVPGATGSCTSQAVEYVGGGKCISSSTFDCGIIYTIDLNTEAVVSLQDPNPFNLSIKDLMYVNVGSPFAVTCNDATLEVQADLSVPFSSYDITNAPANALIAVDAFAGANDIHLYTYNPDTDAISVVEPVLGSTPAGQFYAIDFHPIQNQVYMLNDNAGSERALFSVDLDSGTFTELGAVPSSGGNLQPHAMTIGNDGTIYIAYKSGEINIYDYAANAMLPFADVGAAPAAAGGVGLAYDYDNNRLLHSSGSDGTVSVNAIDIATAVVTPLTAFTGATNAQGFDYVGNNKLVASCTFGCDSIYTVDLVSGVVTVIANPVSDGFSNSIKDIVFIGFEVDLSPDSFDCDDLGANTVDVTVTDEAGNVSTCSATVTVEDPNDFCGLSVDDFTADQVVLYPNPVGDQFQIQWNTNDALESVQIFDITGKRVMLLEAGQNTLNQVDVSGLGTGMYVVKFQSAQGTLVKRLIKQ